MLLTPASEIDARAADWLIHGRIAAGCVNVLTGRAKLGKSTLARWWASQHTSIIVSAEDDPHVVIRPSLERFGADLSRVHVLTGAFSLRTGLGDLDSAIERTHARLVVLDPLSAYLDGLNFGSDAAMRGLFAALQEIARDRGCAVVALVHQVKASVSPSVRGVLGSVGVGAAARSICYVAEHVSDPSLRVLSSTNNLGVDLPPETFNQSMQFAPFASNQAPNRLTSEQKKRARNARYWQKNRDRVLRKRHEL